MTGFRVAGILDPLTLICNETFWLISLSLPLILSSLLENDTNKAELPHSLWISELY